MTKLELVVRDAAGAFSVHTIDSRAAFRGYRPRRIADTGWELGEQPGAVDGRARFVLRSRRADRYLLVGELERAAWELMDGRHSIVEIAGALCVRFGAFDAGLLHRFLARLHASGLLEAPPLSRLRARLSRLPGHTGARLLTALLGALERCHLRLTDVDGWLGALHARGAWLLTTRAAVVAVLGSTAVAAAFLVAALPPIPAVVGELLRRPGASASSILLVGAAGIALHELAHALACKRYGRRVRELGFGLLHGVVPFFYADVTDIFLASRRARIVVSLAGPLANLGLGAAAILSAVSADGYTRAVLVGVGIVQWQLAVVNLWPFSPVALDGYHVLADRLGLPTLRESAWRFASVELPARLRARARLRADEWVLLGWTALTALSTAAFFGVHAFVVTRWLIG